MTLREEFLSKVAARKYISRALFLRLADSADWEVIPRNFDLEKYNNEVLDEEYGRYRKYFETMYAGVDSKIHLDEKQVKAILADEDYALIIAGAGTGKTTTMVSKVKYLVDILKVDPEKILVMSYTKKATEELSQRIVGDFGIPAQVTTFHSLGLMYVRENFRDRKCYVVDDNLRHKIFMQYFKEEIFPFKDKIQKMIEVFDPKLLGKKWVFGDFFKEHYREFADFESYFEAYKRHRIEEQGSNLRNEVVRRISKMLNADRVLTIKRELVKSRMEGVIADYLFCRGIDYEYEKVYQELMEERRAYRPDFTLNVAGQEIYIEYFGLNEAKYNELREKKEAFHKEKGNRFIALDYSMREGEVLHVLRERLEEMGVKFRPKTPQEIFTAILDGNVAAEFYQFRDFLYESIDAIKASTKREGYRKVVSEYFDQLLSLPGATTEELERIKYQFKVIDEFYRFYQKQISGVTEQGFDYSDMIYYANRYFEDLSWNENRLRFKYIIIDEYQDISQERYELVKRVASRDNAKVIAVGDDWQSIYAFSGSRIDYVYNFEKYFPGAKLLKIEQTYRNSQDLIDLSGDFIMKNASQIRKRLISNKRLLDPVRIVEYDEDKEYETMKRIILQIHHAHPERKILVLARKNRTIEDCFKDPELKDGVGSKIEFLSHRDIQLDGMTIHASKGLTSDEVIVIGLDDKFPGNGRHDYWLVELFKMRVATEQIPFAEERRVFYVALTRTREHVYLLVNKDKQKRSRFVWEIEDLINKHNQE